VNYPPLQARAPTGEAVGFQPTRIVFPMHQGEDIGRGLLMKILREVGLTREEFLAIEK
jgi:hypothetical protein